MLGRRDRALLGEGQRVVFVALTTLACVLGACVPLRLSQEELVGKYALDFGRETASAISDAARRPPYFS